MVAELAASGGGGDIFQGVVGQETAPSKSASNPRATAFA
jgi:hypothetical protein